jgi:hypothetical protein
MLNTMVTVSLLVDILDPKTLRAYALELAKKHHKGESDMETLAACAVEAMVLSAPGPSTEYIGFDLDSIESVMVPPTKPRGRSPIVPVESWRIEINATVWDEARLRAYASNRYRICWNHDLTFVNNIEQAVYEALIGSSEGPPTVDYGVRLSQFGYKRKFST